MNVAFDIPDDVATQLSVGGDIQRLALEALALESYRAGRLTKAELRRTLGIESRFEVDAFLKAHDVYDPITIEEVERQVEDVQRLGF
jgi:hypothetical protein